MEKKHIRHAQAKSTPLPPHEERSISSVYPVLDNDLARDNLENHLSAADLQDL